MANLLPLTIRLPTPSLPRSPDPELRWTAKDPQDVVLRVFDVSDRLGADTIVEASVTVSASGQDTALTVATTAIAAQSITLTLSGGTSGTDYAVNVKFQTSGGETINRALHQAVYPLSPSATVTLPLGTMAAILNLLGPSGAAQLLAMVPAGTFNALLATDLGRPGGVAQLLQDAVVVPSPGN